MIIYVFLSDILDNYSRSPYLAADTDFLNPHGNGDIQGMIFWYLTKRFINPEISID